MRAVAGVYLRLGDEIDPSVNARVHALAGALDAHRLPGITDVIPCYACVYVEYDLARLHEATVRRWAACVPVDAAADEGRSVRVPVRYDGADLEYVANAVGLDAAEVVRRHSEVEYRVYAVGFTPGFPFMGVVDQSIRTPRLPTPRARVEAGTVAIADAQSGIYPLPSPGGWRQLGTALTAVYDPHRERPALLEPGDRVRFVPVTAENGVASSAPGRSAGVAAAGAERERPELLPLELLPREPRHPVLQVHEPGLLDIVVDAGRFGGGRLGLARSGPLDARSAATANLLVGNPADAPLLELNVRGPVLEALGACVVAFAGFGVSPVVDAGPAPPFTSFALRAGNTLTFPPQGRGVRGYLAVAGGFESDTFMGSASVDVRGLIGRPLAAGDVLGVAQQHPARPGFSFEPYLRWPAEARPAGKRSAATLTQAMRRTTLRLLPGPQADAAAMRALSARQFRVERADRMGLQLDSGLTKGGDHGSGVRGHGILSEPNPLGGVQITPGGQPLILLHDRGTIGGYAKPAVLHPWDLAIAGQLRVGDLVRFVRG